jgi:protein-S-isoprenylcysteine O-methyltransferase Ste14
MIFLDITIIILLFAFFALSHSLLASNTFKKKLSEKLAGKIAFYRLFYNLASLIIFAAVYSLAPKPNVILYDLQFPFDIITFALQVLSLIGLFWSAKHLNLKEFIGIAQIERYLNGTYQINDLDAKILFNANGANKYVRHPVYFFSILFLGFRPTMSLFYLIMFICLVFYFYAGSIFEERKLVELFGDEYKKYQKDVPRLLPLKFRNSKFQIR